MREMFLSLIIRKVIYKPNLHNAMAKNTNIQAQITVQNLVILILFKDIKPAF